MKNSEMDDVDDQYLLDDNFDASEAMPEGAEDDLVDFLDKLTKIEKKSQYAPGKNPASHGNRKGKLSNRTGNTGDTGRDRRVMAQLRGPGDGKNYLKGAKKHLVKARTAKESGHKGKASYHAQMARKYVRIGRGANSQHGITETPGAAKFSDAKSYRKDQILDRRAAGVSTGSKKARFADRAKYYGKMARKTNAQARMVKSDPGPADVHVSGPIAGKRRKKVRVAKTAGGGMQLYREVIAKARKKSMYGPGKNPNSHKRSGSHGGGRTTGTSISRRTNIGTTSVRQARKAMDAARAAKKAGDIEGMRQHLMAARSSHGKAKSALSSLRSSVQRNDQKAEQYGEGGFYDSMKRHAKRRTSAQQAVQTVLGQKRGARMTHEERSRFDIPLRITKSDKKEQVVYGWASPVTEFGTTIIDKQGDVIDIEDLRKAAHDFMLNSRSGGSMHKDIGIDKASVVESVVLSADLQKALGIDMPYEGWFIGVKIHDANAWKKVESGEYTGFSIGGSGVREAYEDELIEKKSMYGPGKNPASHGNRKGKGAKTGADSAGSKAYASGIARGERARARYDSVMGYKAVSGPADTAVHRDGTMRAGARQVKENMTLARKAKASGNMADAKYHVGMARAAHTDAKYAARNPGSPKFSKLPKRPNSGKKGVDRLLKDPPTRKGVDMASKGTYVGGKLRLQPELQDAPKKKKKSSKGGFGWGLR